MFNKEQLGVLDWFLYFIIMSIPLVNLIFYFVILFSGSANKTLRSLQWAQVTLVLLFIGLIVGLIMIVGFGPILEEYVQQLQEYIAINLG